MTYEKCELCPRRCGVDRNSRRGFCLGGVKASVTRAAKHFWEEPVISGKNGSGTVFFSGCALRCVFCQNYEISRKNVGREVSDSELADIFLSLQSDGAENINLVNPVHFAPSIKNSLEAAELKIPVVWNSGGYERAETLRELEGLIDIYLPDFKYIRNDKALRYSKAADYPSVAKAALAEMRRQCPQEVFENGVMKSGMIIRHLILPQNTNSSLEIIDYLAANFKDTYISLMAQYIPCGELKAYPEINRQITQREYDKVADYAASSGLEKVFLQNLSSSSKNFIPAFDFTGIM